MKYRIWKRALCCLLSMILILGNLPVFSFAEESDGLCEHHTVHTSECGYSPAIPGSPCTHEHTQDCYQTVAECIHVHDDACGYNEEAGDASCTHVCSEEYGCFKLVPDCRHGHDESCGYVEATPEQPCTYSCTECAEPGEDPSEPEEDPSEPEEDPSEPEVDEAVEAVRALIEALPTLEEIMAMSTQEQSEVYTQVQKAYDAYDALTDDQKAQLPDAEEIFTSLFEYFNSLTAPAADVLLSGSCGANLTYTLDDNGTLTISGTGAMNSYSDAYSTPWYSNLSDIARIVIEDGITSIGDYAFGCVTYPNVSSVIVPKSVTKLGLYAFGGNNIQVRYAGTMTEWMSINFYYAEDFWAAPGAVCSDGTILTLGFCGKYGVSGSPRYVLTSDGCMRIYGTGDMQFNKNLTNRSHWSTYNSSITSVVVEDGVTSIADYSFEGCKNLTTVTLPNNLRSIGTYAFRSCTALKAIDIPSSVTYLGSGVFQSSGLESIEIPEGVKYIKDYSFLNCSALSSVTIPSSVTDIGGQAFYGCSVLTDIYYGSDEQAWNQITIAANNNSLSSATIHYTNPCAEGHTEETISGKAATCTEDGLTDGKKCSVCGEILEKQTVIPASHNFVDGFCSKCGAITGSCGADGDNLTYLLTTDGKLTISGSGKMADYTRSYSPSDSAPWDSKCDKITSIVLTDGVTSIGNYAFDGCSNLASVTIPDGVSSIGQRAFSGCSGLTSVTIPEGVTSIGNATFDGCSSLTSVSIPEGVTSIGDYAFNGCSSLTSVTIPKGVTSIGHSAFDGCSSLTSVTIPEGVTSIGDSTFSGCSGLTSVSIPDGVSSIGGYAFSGCSSLTSVTIPDSVSSISPYAFQGCSSLTSVTIPKSVTSIGSAAFKNCTGLTTVQFLGDGFTGTADIFNNPVTAYYPHGNTTWTQEIRDSFGSYVTWAEACTNGTTHTEVIDEAKAPTCTETGLTVGKHCSVCGTVLVAQKEISATGHTEETIPGKDATCTEDGLTDGKKCSVCGEILQEQQVIPASHNFVDGVCSGCGAITGSCGAEGDNLTYLLTTDGKLTISGSGKMADYSDRSSAPWYSERTKITSVVLTDGVTSIGYYAFYACIKLTSVTIPDSVSSIESFTFYGCSGLTSVTIPDGVSSIEAFTFYGCSGLTSVTIPDSVSSIGLGAFEGCSGLTSVTIPDGVSSIGSRAFFGCSGLTSVTIPDGVSSIREYAFENCTGLTTVQFLGDGFTGTADIFNNPVTAYYPHGNTTWTQEIRDSFGSYVTWVEACTNGTTHTEVIDPAVEPTCTKTGLTEGKHCSVCGMVLVAQEKIPAAGHKLDVVEGKEATCTETGIQAHYHCSVCDKNYVDAEGTQEMSDTTIPATDHTKKTVPGTAATCEKDGLTDGTVCSVCGAVLVAQTVIPAAHTLFKVEGKDATCTGNGVIAHYRCKVCGRRFADESAKTELTDTVLPAGHRFDESNKCTVCGVIGGKWGDQGTWELVDGCLTIQGSPMIDQLCPALSDAPWGIYSNDIHEIVIGNNIGISENAFANLANLEAVTISATDGIRDKAFAGCGKLNTITFTEAVPFAISQTAFTGVTATAHYKVESNTQLYSNLQNYGGNLTWVEHGDNAKRIEIILYGSSGGVGSFVVQTYPNKTTADCEFTLSAEGVIELTSQYFRGATFRELSPGEVTVTARDKSTGLTASCTIFVADTQPKDIDCPYEEEILIDGTIIRREYRFIPQATGYYASYNSYMGEAGGITVTQGDSWVDRVSSQYIPSDGEYGVYYLTAGETYSISLECDSWYYGTYATFRWTQPETQVTSVFFEEEEFHFDLAPGTQDQSAWASAYVTPGECLGKLTWSIGDSTVAEIQSSDGNNCCLTLKKAGTTTLTASCGDKSASVPLVVHSPVELKLNQTAQLNHYKNTYNRMVQFTAEEDGQYVFTVQGASSVSIDGQMQYPNGYGTDGNTYFTKVSAGQTVVLRLGLHEDSSAAVSVAKAESKPDSMELICLSNNQHKVSFGVSFSPATSMDKIVSWTVSDPDLLGELSTYDSSNSKQSYIPYAKGQVTVTATSASGLSASCTLTVGRCFDGHTNVPQVIAATCTTGGFTINTCSVCGEKTITARVNALGHGLTHHDAQAATCSEIGWEAYDTCSRCDYTTYEEIPATGHTFSHVNSAPATCTEEGVKEHYHCSVCGKDFEDENGTKELSTVSIPAASHTEETIPGKAATCTETGLTDGKKCSVCGEILEAQQTIPASHNFVNGVCSECGAITGSCGFNGDNLIYILTTDGTLTISGTGSMNHYNAYSTAPWYAMRDTISSVVLTEGVSSIGEYAFNGCLNLTSVTIPEGVNTIGSFAFCNCSSLNSVIIPDGVTYLGASAFDGCSSLTSINIPEGNIYIRGGTFHNCSSLTSITIPKGVTSIGSTAFSGCSRLTSVTIPEGVNTIGSSAFRDCSSLTSIAIPKGVTSIEVGTFWDCSSLTSVTIPEGITTIGSSAFRGCKNLKAITIPEGVSSIGECAFKGCSSLDSIVIPKGVTTIEFQTFEDCTSLTSVVIPEGVTAIELDAFKGCTALTSVTIPKGLTSIGGYAFSGCSSLTSVTIPDSVTSIESYAFRGCSKLTSVIIPEGISSIKGGTFSGCSGLTSITIPEGVTSIGNGAFWCCSSLTSVTIPEGVTSIEDDAFYGCSKLTSVTIPNSVTSIGSGAFMNCRGLTTVQFLGDGFTGTADIFNYAVTAYYPHGNTTWTQEIRDSFGLRVTWKEACIGALEHTEITDEAKAPTCTETGLTEGSHCSVCGTVLVAQEEISATGHTLTMVEGKEATCTEAGVKAHYHCTTCLKNFEDKNGTKELSVITIPTAEHEWGEWEVTTPATPEAEGEETRKCANCQQEETRPLAYSGNRLELTGTELENQGTVWIDGAPIPVQKDDAGNSYVTLPENSSSILVTYSFNTGSGDRHTQYPTGMKVYRVEKTDSGLTVAHLPELDNLLQYSGCSIRIVGVKGIRMITSISKSTRSALMGDGLAGYKLVEYGTALCRASALEGGAPMVLGTPGVKSNYAYKRGVADPIFKDTGSLIQYTNVLVGFTDEDCKEDIAMRPYIILEDEKGETVTLYGGTVYRSIGYIAYQNRSAFAPGTAAYDYVWNIIHYVYGDQYDADYKG